MEKPQRRTPRYPFTASAQVVCDGSNLTSKVSALSLYGCYLNASRPLPRGSDVVVKIISDGDLFESSATVVYSQQDCGMGVAFRDVKSVFLAVLHKWLRQALKKSNAPASAGDLEPEQEM
jgi:hypothetical protein